MAVRKIAVGRKLIAVSTYCPDDVLGLAACEYLIERIIAALPVSVPETELRAWLIERDARWTEIFEQLDRDESLPKFPPWAINPSNAAAEIDIARTMRVEEMQKRSNCATGI